MKSKIENEKGSAKMNSKKMFWLYILFFISFSMALCYDNYTLNHEFQIKNSQLQLKNQNREAKIESIPNIRMANLDSISTKEIQIEKEEKEKEPVYWLSQYERWVVVSIVAGEAGIEPYEGKVAVASCILNACLLEDKRPEEIQSMYGYAGWQPIQEFESECMDAYGNTNLADEVRQAVSQVFDDGEILDNEILWFCSGYSKWHESQKFVIEIGGHRFFAPW